MASIAARGVGEDFFSKFVTAEPVSVVLKQQLSASFDVFQPDSLKTPPDAEDAASDELPLEAFPVPASLAALSECHAFSSALQCFERVRAKRPVLVEELAMSLLVLGYCCLLISQSLPSKARPLRVVRLRDRLSRLKSSLELSTNSFASRCSIPTALNLIAVNSVACPSLAASS